MYFNRLLKIGDRVSKICVVSERHNHSINIVARSQEVVRAFRDNGVRGAVTVIVGIGICPADDIAALAATSMSATSEAAVHQGSMPSEDQYRLKLSDPDRRGKKIPRKVKP